MVPIEERLDIDIIDVVAACCVLHNITSKGKTFKKNER